MLAEDTRGLSTAVEQTMESVSEAKLSLVNPELARRVRQLETLFGGELVVVQGLRSWAEQQAIWLKGRDAQGNVVDASRIVTNAPPGHSWHEFGLAVDCVPRILINEPNWAPDDALWVRYGSCAETAGLVWGGRWKRPDRPHVQYTGKFPVSPNDEVRQAFLTGGTAEVWQAV